MTDEQKEKPTTAEMKSRQRKIRRRDEEQLPSQHAPGKRAKTGK